MVKIRRNRARAARQHAPRLPAHAVRLCSTAPGKRGRGAARFAAGRNNGLKERRGRQGEGPLPGSRPIFPPRGVHLCRRLPRMGMLFARLCCCAWPIPCAFVCASYPTAAPCVDALCAPVPPVLHGCTPLQPCAYAGLPARICPAPRWPRTCFAGAARFAAHGAPCGKGLFLLY